MKNTLEECYANITLEEEDEGGIIFDENTGEDDAIDFRWCLVGRFLTDRPINIVAMKNTLTSIWRLVKGVYQGLKAYTISIPIFP